MGRALAVVALCGVGRVAAAEPPKRVLAHVTMHHGIALVSDERDDGASSPGVALGFQAGVQYRLLPQVSVGAALDLTFSEHDSDASASAKAKYTNYMLSAVGRLDLGRFALLSWAGYHVGQRAVREPGGLFGGRTFSEDGTSGLVAAGAGVVRIRVPSAQPIHIEIGPFVQGGLFGTDADTSVRTMVVGLVFQAAYNAPEIHGAQGDSF